METTIMGIIKGYIILGLYWDNGKESGNHYNGDYILGVHYIGVVLGDNGKENGNHYNGDYILGVYYIGVVLG